MPILSDERTTNPPLRHPQRYERVADHLVGEVRRGALAAGERLPSERDLARRLGVGRSSVREAIAALQLRGLVETRPGAGSFITADAHERAAQEHDEPSHDASPSAVLEARLAFEPAVVRLAAARAVPDPEAERLLEAMEREPDRAAWNRADRLFHRRLAAMTDNPVLLAMADSIAALMDQPLWQRLRDESVAAPGRMALHAAEHRLIYEAVVTGDAEAAAFYTTQHIDRVRRYMTLEPATT